MWMWMWVVAAISARSLAHLFLPADCQPDGLPLPVAVLLRGANEEPVLLGGKLLVLGGGLLVLELLRAKRGAFLMRPRCVR